MKEKYIKEFGSQKVPYVEGDPWSGITKREYFAGLAMQGLLANSNIAESLTRTEIEWVSEKSVILANTLIEQLTKEV